MRTDIPASAPVRVAHPTACSLINSLSEKMFQTGFVVMLLRFGCCICRLFVHILLQSRRVRHAHPICPPLFKCAWRTLRLVL